MSSDVPTEPLPPRKASKLRVLSRSLTMGLAVGYVAGLVAAALAMRFVGERWWFTTGLLYLPRLGFAWPLPIVVLCVALFGPRRLLLALPLPVFILVFPVMGLRLGTGSLAKDARASAPSLRVLSYNVADEEPAQRIAGVIHAANPDIALIQEMNWREIAPLLKAAPTYEQRFDGEFGILSRFPIKEVVRPPRIGVPGMRDQLPMYVRYRVETPNGVVTIFNMHPVSPRDGLEEFREQGLWQQVKHRRFYKNKSIELLRKNAAVRWRQAEAVADAAREVEGSVIIAGDTNLPTLSRIYAETLAPFRDGFAEVGRGFGYTYPARRPWMRIDRILVRGPLSFQHFEVMERRGSDHRPIFADLAP